ncbi:MAG: NADH-quinone oxidoreductase subunit N [Planctomycetota bacterium]
MEHFYELIQRNTGDLRTIAPEIMVFATFLMALIFDFKLSHDKRVGTGWLCVAGITLALWLNLKQNYLFNSGLLENQNAFSGMFHFDWYGTAFKTVLLLGTLTALVVAIHAKEIQGKNHGEFFLLVVAVCAGGMFLCSASNLLMIYLALESLSIISYAMAGYLRRDRKSAEAGIKYVIYGAMASGIMIYGMSYVYGLTGTLDLYGHHGIVGVLSSWSKAEALKAVSPIGLIAVLAMVFVGFLYKIAAAPFHYWSPDVYEGSPTVAAGFFSVVPKAAGFAALIRVAVALFPAGSEMVWKLDRSGFETILMTLSVLTMCIGNLAALGQTNVKRMLAYSSIAHAGYMLAGLSMLNSTTGPAGEVEKLFGPAAILFYLLGYLVMNFGAFLVLVGLENIVGGTDLRHLRGAIRREPILAVALCIFLFSLTGLPPFGGFMGKWFVVVELAKRARYGMIVWIGLNSVVSLYYYMRIAKAVAIDAPPEGTAPTETVPLAYNVMAVGKCVALLLLFIFSEPLIEICKHAFVRIGM